MNQIRSKKAITGANRENSFFSSPEQLEQMLSLAQIGLWKFAYQNNDFTCSQFYKQILHLDSATDLSIETGLFPYIPPTSLTDLIEILLNQNTKTSFSLSFQSSLSEDESWLLLKCEKVFDEQNNFLFCQGTLQHLSAQAVNEKKVNQDLAKFKSIFDNNKLGMAILDKDEKIIKINDSFCEMTEYSRGEIENIYYIKDLISTDSDFFTLKEAEKAFHSSGGNKLDIIRIFKTKTGRSFICNVVVTAIYGNSGHLDFQVGILEDITEKIETQKLIKESEEKFRGLFESSPFPLALINSEGILEANTAAVHFFGYSKKELKAKGGEMNIFPSFQPNGNDSKIVWDNQKLLAFQYGVHKSECILQNSSLEEFPAEVTLSPIVIEGKRTIYAIFNDLTLQKQHEDKIQTLLKSVRNQNSILEEKVEQRTASLKTSYEELKRSNEDLEQFAYVASHDLQEPLRTIGNFVQLLERKYSDQIGADGKAYIKFAVDGAQRMSKLITELLQYSRVGRDRATQNEKTDLRKLIEYKLLDLDKKIKERKATILIKDLPEEIICEPDLIGMVFFNLIANGLKFNIEKNPLITLDYSENKDEYLFSIEDNGIGISEEYRERIFEIFKRLHRKDEYEGTGIGLSLCKKIITRHKGKIWIENASPKGTVFCFTISKSLKPI